MKKIALFSNPGSLNARRFLIYAIVYISVGIGISMLGPLLPFLADQVSVSLGQMGFAFTAQNLGYLIGSLSGGWLFDRVRTHRLMTLFLLVMILTGFLIPLMSWFSTLLIVLFFFGLGVGAIDVGTNLNMVWIFQSGVGPYLNALHFIFGIGAFFTPLIITTVLGWTGGSLSWAIWALMLLFIPGLLGLVSSPSPENPAAVKTESPEKVHHVGIILMLILAIFFAVGVQIGFSGWIFSYVSESGIADIATASRITALFWASLSLGRLIAIPISKKVAPGTMVLFNFSLLTLVVIFLLIWPIHPVMMWIGAAGVGLATSILFPTLLSYAKTLVNMTGRVTGLLFLGSSLGMMILPLLLGQMFDRFGGFAMILVVFGASLLGLGIIILLRFQRASIKATE
ncbi:MAG TPA: MFS transporter [Brevefilum sp.]|nr:MFS transporter [Brevefilum sp.]HOR20045.1 MFS transporter [Brevefilum sp.]HPL69284.1 MFS transporter [Brevefilum sp.]